MVLVWFHSTLWKVLKSGPRDHALNVSLATVCYLPTRLSCWPPLEDKSNIISLVFVLRIWIWSLKYSALVQKFTFVGKITGMDICFGIWQNWRLSLPRRWLLYVVIWRFLLIVTNHHPGDDNDVLFMYEKMLFMPKQSKDYWWQQYHSMIVKIKNAPKLRDIEQPVLVGISSLQKLLKLVPVFTSWWWLWWGGSLRDSADDVNICRHQHCHL